jgi:hypothetical protein
LAHRFPALIAAPAAARERIWLTGARLFGGTGSPLRENAAILIEDGIIRRVADAAEPAARVSQLERHPRITRLPQLARRQDCQPRHVQKLPVIGHK